MSIDGDVVRETFQYVLRSHKVTLVNKPEPLQMIELCMKGCWRVSCNLSLADGWLETGIRCDLKWRRYKWKIGHIELDTIPEATSQSVWEDIPCLHVKSGEHDGSQIFVTSQGILEAAAKDVLLWFWPNCDWLSCVKVQTASSTNKPLYNVHYQPPLGPL